MYIYIGKAILIKCITRLECNIRIKRKVGVEIPIEKLQPQYQLGYPAGYREIDY